MATTVMKSWRGMAFEEVCFNHIDQIKRSLGISGVKTSVSLWAVAGGENTDGAQIDMIIKRDDNVVNLCEMKFCGSEYSIEKDESMKLRNRIEALKATLSPKQTVHLTMVTTFGVAAGKHSGIVQKNVVMDDLFE